MIFRDSPKDYDFLEMAYVSDPDNQHLLKDLPYGQRTIEGLKVAYQYQLAHYADPDNRYWNETHQATEGKDLFLFKKNNGVDTIWDFALEDKIRFVHFAGTFRDLTFAVDTEAQTITLRFAASSDGSANQITLRKAAALIGPDGESLLTAANFHFVQTDWGQDRDRDGVVLEGGWGDAILRGGPGDDTLTGGWGNDELYGGPGDDILHSGWGNDELYGGPGDDHLHTSRGDAILHGGRGDDLLDTSGSNDELYGGRGDDLLEASDGNNELYGGSGQDILKTSNGNNELHGGKGNDLLETSHGNNELYGGRGDDILEVSYGDNRLVGGKGNDTLVSGLGADTFVFREGDGHDTIENFGFGWSGNYPGKSTTLRSERRARKAAEANGEVDVIELHLKLPATTTAAAAFAGLQIEGQGADTVIGYGAGDDTITLEDVAPSSLTLDDFDFVFVG